MRILNTYLSINGTLNIGSYYASRMIKLDNGKWRVQYMHRFIMNTPNGMYPDHIDFNTLNNQRSNLRNLTASESNRHQRIKKTNKSGCIGVSWYKAIKKWRADIKVNGKLVYLGSFENIKDAIFARRKKEKELGFNIYY